MTFSIDAARKKKAKYIALAQSSLAAETTPLTAAHSGGRSLGRNSRDAATYAGHFAVCASAHVTAPHSTTPALARKPAISSTGSKTARNSVLTNVAEPTILPPLGRSNMRGDHI
jgi:hypothetical protein